MSATDELRRLLDERGVEWSEGLGNEHRVETFFDDMNGHTALFVDFGDGNPFGGESELSADLTPAQAVEATLGRGTCRVVRKPVSYSDDWKESLEAAGVVEVYTPTCSECGAYIEPPSEFTAGWNYCPNCGRRIEVDA